MSDDPDLDLPDQFIVLEPGRRAARCRVLGSGEELTLRSRSARDLVPAEIVAVRPRKAWHHAGHTYLSGDVTQHRLDVQALGLVPLRLCGEYLWDPLDYLRDLLDEPVEDWVKPIVARGPRPCFELEYAPLGTDSEPHPILDAVELDAAGDSRGAEKIVLETLAADLRCLDGHAFLGNLSFDEDPEKAARHYEAGARIGELSLREGFDGVLSWVRIDNRGFLRCVHGLGLCRWRLGREEEAAILFERLLWLNPTDNQGVRFLLPRTRAGASWEDYSEENSLE